jgi:hypothetical protein
MTTLSSTEIAQLTAIITGGSYKRSANKEAAIKRFITVATENNILGPDATLGMSFEAARADLHAQMDMRKPEAPALPKCGKSRRAAIKVIEAEVPVPTIAKKTRASNAQAGQQMPRPATKQAAMIEMLRAPEGTTIAAIMEKTGWQAHTVRGAFAGALKKAGLNVTSEKIDGRGRVYRIA